MISLICLKARFFSSSPSPFKTRQHCAPQKRTPLNKTKHVFLPPRDWWPIKCQSLVERIFLSYFSVPLSPARDVFSTNNHPLGIRLPATNAGESGYKDFLAKVVIPLILPRVSQSSPGFPMVPQLPRSLKNPYNRRRSRIFSAWRKPGSLSFACCGNRASTASWRALGVFMWWVRRTFSREGRWIGGILTSKLPTFLLRMCFQTNLGGGFKYLLFSSLFGEDSYFD